MNNQFAHTLRQPTSVALSLLTWQLCQPALHANPVGGVATQGSASLNTSGKTLTVTTSDKAYINWQSFDIPLGETTVFAQPSANSVVWNHINGGNPSQIMGTLTANGYIVLQNQSGFVVGGKAAITAHGLVMSTAPSAVPNLSSGGPWTFNAPPPLAKIINYGQINITDGGSAFLIASDIENQKGATISAPGGQIGLYAGETVLVSQTPDGRGLSAQVTLPQGSVDNEGRLIADAGTIAAQAQTVNQNGLVQADAVKNVNGVIELVASDSLSLGAHSDIEAHGDTTTGNPSNGGFVVLQAANNFSDTPTSLINVNGAGGGLDGVVEVFGQNLTDATSIQSQIDGLSAGQFSAQDILLVNPYDVTISADPTDTSTANPTINTDTLASYSQIDLHALDNIELSATLNLPDSTSAASLNLVAGNDIILDAGSGILAGNNWNVSLTAGTGLAAGTPPTAGNDGIYLNDDPNGVVNGAVIQTQNGDISATAANEVIIQDSQVDPSGNVTSSSGSIRTLNGGNIQVTAQSGNVSAGNSIYGYVFGLDTAPYYAVDSEELGGISTAAGGNVTISAAGSVTSYLPNKSDYALNQAGYDGGTGAFGPEPGNVTITAGTTIAGNYVVANGVGTIAAGGDAGVPAASTDVGFALSLVKGSWTVSAPKIFLDDVLNPNGVFNDVTTSKGLPGVGAHVFDYDPAASLTLNGADSVEITGAAVPLVPASDITRLPIPVLLPPSLTINAGAGGIVLDTDVILFRSPMGNVNLTTTHGGSFVTRQNPNDPHDVNTHSLVMSDSSQDQWSYLVGNNFATEIFSIDDHAATPAEVNNPNPVAINIAGSIDNVNIYSTKATDLTVHGNMFNAGFVGKNLHATDVTTVTVDGSISFSPIYTFATLAAPIQGVNAQYPYWDSIFSLLVNANPKLGPSVTQAIPAADLGNLAALKSLAATELALGSNPGFVYNASTDQLGYTYQMNSKTLAALAGTLAIIKTDNFGNPQVVAGQKSLGQDPNQSYFVTTPVDFVPASLITSLYNSSQNSVKNSGSLSPGFQIGGPGQLVVKAGNLDLGASGGIVSWGAGNGSQSVGGGVNYANLASLTGASGASIDVSVTGTLGMLTSTIATLAGGDVTVNSINGEIDLGLPGLPFNPPNLGNLAYGIYTSWTGDVNVTANNNINIDTARIAAFNGGKVNVESYNGDVNAGDGINQTLLVPESYVDPKTGRVVNLQIEAPRPYGSGILALTPNPKYQVPGGSGLPGSITVTTPNGDIISTLGGISQFALNGNIAGGPSVFVDLLAGTKGANYIQDPSGLAKDSAGHVQYGLEVNGNFKPEGNIDLGKGGVVGGSVNLSAQGNITGLIVSRQDANVTAQQNVTVTVLSGGNASVSGGGKVSGDIVAQGSASVSGDDAGLAVFGSSVGGSSGVANSVTAATASTAATGAGAEASKPIASNTDSDSDDLTKKKAPAISLKVKRVTVFLPGKS